MEGQPQPPSASGQRPMLPPHPAGDGRVPRGKVRRHRPWLRTLVALFVAIELVITILVGYYSPVYDFEITSVIAINGSTTIARNPDLTYPVKLAGGNLCRPSDFDLCLADEELSDTCCTELRSSSSSGPEELISSVMMFGYVAVIPGLILLMRGFLLGRVWAMRPFQEAPPRDPTKGAWGKERWHLRVGFYSLDTCLGLAASLVTTLMFTAILKVTAGRPRPNYWALQMFTENAANGDDFSETMIRSWPSGHSSSSAAGLLFLTHVLWYDLLALLEWRRHAHPKITLVLAVLGGFVLAGLPLAAILIGISGIRDYWHRPDEVLAGLVLGAVLAHWSFRFVVLMPFSHEVGSPQWVPEPRWVAEEDNALRGLGEHEDGRGYPVKARDRQARRGQMAADDSVPTPTGKPAAYDQALPRLPSSRGTESDQVNPGKSDQV